MDNTARLVRLKEKDYQKIFCVTKTIFDQMLTILEETYRQEHRRGEHPPKNRKIMTGSSQLNM